MRAMLIDDQSPRRSQVEIIQKILQDEFDVLVEEPYLFIGKYGVEEFSRLVQEVDEPPDIAIVDYFLKFVSAQQEIWHGLEVARCLRKRWEGKKPFYILFVSAYLQQAEGRYETLVDLLRVPLTGFLQFSGEWEDNFRQHVRMDLNAVKAVGQHEIEEAIESFGEDNYEEFLGAFVGQISPVVELGKAIKKVAPTDLPVLIHGESGTGKELIAAAIYHQSNRASQPFMAINCAALPENLLESELFGHEKGAFTGADHRRIGRFEQCDGGTIFLDELGDMAPVVQGKVLRLLQDQRFERVGGNETISTNVRIITATNHNLDEAIREKRFREDLYYRLSVFQIQIPPLRERGDDILRLADHFLEKHRVNLGSHAIKFTRDAQKWLMNYRWPGNARELENTIRKAIVLSDGKEITTAELAWGIDQLTAKKRNEYSSVEEIFELTWPDAEAALARMYWEARLRKFDGDIGKTAKGSGIRYRETLSRKLTELGLSEFARRLRNGDI